MINNKNKIFMVLIIVSALCVGALVLSPLATDAEGCNNEVTEKPLDTINLGFIGYYVWGDNVLSTSIYWQCLKEGDTIDWVAVDWAYSDWVANGGLESDRTLWQTSGYTSFTFEDYAALGCEDFTQGQLEGYYQEYYVDPGYIVVTPVTTDVEVTLCFDAWLDGVWWTGLNYYETHQLGTLITPNWDRIYEEYATQANVTPGWMDENRVVGWQSSGIVSVYLTGAYPSIELTENLFDQLMLSGDTLLITLRPDVMAEQKNIDYEFDVTVFHRDTGTGAYLVYPGVGEKFSNTDKDYVEWLNNVDGFTFLNLYLAALRTNDPADMATVDGYVCISAEKNDISDRSFDLEQLGSGENITALVTPNSGGHYAITFWYSAKSSDDGTGGDTGGTGETQTPVFEVSIFKPQTGSVNYVYVNGVKVGEMKVETKKFSVDGYDIIIKLNDRGKGNNTWIFDFTWDTVKRS